MPQSQIVFGERLPTLKSRPGLSPSYIEWLCHQPGAIAHRLDVGPILAMDDAIYLRRTDIVLLDQRRLANSLIVLPADLKNVRFYEFRFTRLVAV